MNKNGEIIPNLQPAITGVAMPKQPKEPRDLNAAFSWEHLQPVAQIIFDWARWVDDHALPQEALCSLGLRRWDLAKIHIMEAAAKRFGFLGIVDPGNKFTFSFDGVPIRFLKGATGEPLPIRYATPTPAERRMQMELALGSDGGPVEDIVYRMITQMDENGRRPVGVYFVVGDGTIEGTILHAWPIPVSDSDTGTTGADVVTLVPPTAPVELPPLFIQSIYEAEAEEAERARIEAEEAKRVEEEQRKKSLHIVRDREA